MLLVNLHGEEIWRKKISMERQNRLSSVILLSYNAATSSRRGNAVRFIAITTARQNHLPCTLFWSPASAAAGVKGCLWQLHQPAHTASSSWSRYRQQSMHTLFYHFCVWTQQLQIWVSCQSNSICLISKRIVITYAWPSWASRGSKDGIHQQLLPLQSALTPFFCQWTNPP